MAHYKNMFYALVCGGKVTSVGVESHDMYKLRDRRNASLHNEPFSVINLTHPKNKEMARQVGFLEVRGDTTEDTEAYLCLCEDGTYIAHEGSLEDVPSEVIQVWRPGKTLHRTVTFTEEK